MKTTLLSIENSLMNLRGHQVLIDRDVASLYGVATKRVNEAVKNNLEKFLPKYCIVLTGFAYFDLWSKISSANHTFTRVLFKDGRKGQKQ